MERVLRESRSMNPVVQQVVAMGISVHMAEQVQQLVGNDPEAIVTYIYDNLM